MKVIGYGDNVVDRYVNKKIMFPGGNAVNFAVYAKESGLDASLLLNFADDREADHIIDSMKEMGIGLTGCRREFGATTERCDVNLVEGDRIFIADDLRETKAAPPLLTEKDLRYLDTFDLVHSGCYAAVESEISKLKELKGLVTFDFSVEPEFKEDPYLEQICPYIDMALFSCEGMDQEEIHVLQKKVYDMGTKYILTTKGTDGQILFNGETHYTGIVELVEAVDTMGAGDSFFTSFVCTLLKEGWTKKNPLTNQMIDTAFHTAAKFSAQNCLREGAFGYAREMED